MYDPKAVSGMLMKEIPTLFKPISYFGAAMGIALISIAFAGVKIPVVCRTTPRTEFWSLS